MRKCMINIPWIQYIISKHGRMVSKNSFGFERNWTKESVLDVHDLLSAARRYTFIIRKRVIPLVE